MMPLAPQLSIPYFDQLSTITKIRNQGEMKASKPKLSFSIDSIVGKRKTFETSSTINDRSNDNDGASQDDASNDQKPLERSLKKRSRESLDGQTQSLMIDRPDSSSPQSSLDTNRRSISPLSNGLLFNDNISSQPHQHHHTETGSSPARSLSPLSLVINNSNTRNIQPNVSQLVTTATNKQPQQLAGPQSTTANSSSHSPLSSTPPAPATSRQCSTPTSGQIPQVSTMGHPNHPMMVAAAAAAAAASSAAAAHQFPSLPNDYQQHAAAFYPWFLRANPFAGRFPGMPFDTPLGSFLLPPFRKPKRIRTAFSPGQLLKLEQAFEKNHYVVGNERKQLANHLGLSETQVKVWFQNRRTKHKRQKQEDEESGSGSVTNGDNNSNNANNKDYSDEDDEEIDLEDEDCQSDEQDQDDGTNNNNNSNTNNSNHHNAAALKFANMHHLWYQSAMSAGLMGDHPPVTSSGSN